MASQKHDELKLHYNFITLITKDILEHYRCNRETCSLKYRLTFKKIEEFFIFGNNLGMKKPC